MSQAYFDQVAGRWDELRTSMFSEAVRTAALSHAGLHPNATAVDLGAGTGFVAQGLAPWVAKVHVIDFSSEMLSVARANLSGFSNVEYHLADGASLPLNDGSVDAVLANMYLHHAPQPADAISEMARLLKPGGRVVITDLDEHTHTWLQTEQHDLWLGFPRARVHAWLEQAGLVNVFVEDTAETCTSRSEAGVEQATVSIFVAVGTRPQPGMQPAVADYYREIALSGSSCCGTSASTSPSPASAESVPLEMLSAAGDSCCSPSASSCCGSTEVQESEAELSLGCGNPVALANLRPGQVVLDIGSGAGADVFPAARKVGPAGKVIGLDMLDEMLARARATAEKNGYANVEFRQGDAQSIPLEDSSVDVVMSNCVINLVQDKGKAFREAHRVLRKGGQLSISDIVTDRPFTPAVRQDTGSWAACVAGALSETEYLALIAQAGFSQFSLARSQAWPAEDGTRVYSLSITAKKPQ
ncbi:MAG TPA: methyltransferase domain-containing protein [Anaerolineales bacterium]|nr:methyltransferase domain-containing protein [Anaerolineales bacterium]